MKIALLGGTFDPPHFGHLLVARQVLEEVSGIDKVWLLPANTNPDKIVYASPSDRLTMTKFLEERDIAVCDYDIKRGGPTYTYDTINNFCKDKKNSYVWLMGSDLLKSIKSWQGFDRFTKMMPFLIFPRPDYPAENVLRGFTVLPENKLITANYSSTVIRERVSEGLSIKGLVPNRVDEYIKKRGLYLNKKVYV